MEDKTIDLHKYGMPLLAILCITLIVFPIFLKPFYTRGEPREALTAQAMLRTGDWILPMRYGNRIATKPPLTHWLVAAISSLYGEVTEWTARLPSALCCLICLCLFYRFVAARDGPAVALVSCTILLMCLEWYRAATTARVDMLLSALLVMALMQVTVWAERSFNGVPYLIIILLALAALTKGPIAIVLPSAIIATAMWIRSQTPLQIAIKLGSIALSTAVLSGLWYYAAYRQGGTQFLEIVLDENWRRFTGNMLRGNNPHTHSALYLYATLALGLLPWSAPIALLPKSSWQSAWQKVINCVKAPLRWFHARSDHDLICTLTIVVFLVFFSLPSSKRSVYLLPIYPFVCLLLARVFCSTWKISPAFRRRTSIALGSFILLSTALLGLVASDALPVANALSSPRHRVAWEVYRAMAQHPFINTDRSALICISLTSLLAIALLLLQRKLSSRAAALICYAGLYLFFFTVAAQLLPTFGTQLSGKEFISRMKPVVSNRSQFYAWKRDFFELSFYLNQTIMEQFAPVACNEEKLILAHEHQLDSLREILPAGCKLEELMRSERGITKPHYTVVLAQITELDRLQPSNQVTYITR